MREELWGAKYSMFKLVCQRIWLTFLIFILFFGTIDPSLNLALAQDTKRQVINYDLVKPLDNQTEALFILYDFLKSFRGSSSYFE